jgi:succinate dehydrogenase assembly factor 2
MLRISQRSPSLLRSSVILSRSLSKAKKRHADPWPLPGSPEHLKSTKTPAPDPSLPEIKPIERKNEDMKTLMSRLVYQSRKRGTLEADLLLSTFARDQLPVMSMQEMLEYDKVRPSVPCGRSVLMGWAKAAQRT